MTPGGNKSLNMLRPRNYTVKLYHSLTQIFHHFRQNKAHKEQGGKKIAQTANYSLSSDDDFITSTTFHKKEVIEMWNLPDWLGFVVWSEVACIDWHSDPTSFRSRAANKRIFFFKHFLITFYIFPPSDQQPLPTWLKKKTLIIIYYIYY